MKKLLSLSVLTLLFAAACHHDMGSGVRGSGNRQTQTRQVAPFTSITAEGAFTIEVVCQKDLSVEVEGDDNVLPLVSTDVKSGVLQLSNTNSYSVNQPIVIKISVPNLEALSINGAGKLEITKLNNEKFELDANGEHRYAQSSRGKSGRGEQRCFESRSWRFRSTRCDGFRTFAGYLPRRSGCQQNDSRSGKNREATGSRRVNHKKHKRHKRHKSC
jgi:hypothetical protein